MVRVGRRLKFLSVAGLLLASAPTTTFAFGSGYTTDGCSLQERCRQSTTLLDT